MHPVVVVVRAGQPSSPRPDVVFSFDIPLQEGAFGVQYSYKRKENAFIAGISQLPMHAYVL